jgi:hypothetical protein
MRSISEVVPSISGQLDTVAMLMKLAKHIGIKFPYKYYIDLIDTPFSTYLKTHDNEFFKSPLFEIIGFSDLTKEIKNVLTCSSRETLDIIWDNIEMVMDATDKVNDYKVDKMLAIP